LRRVQYIVDVNGSLVYCADLINMMKHFSCHRRDRPQSVTTPVYRVWQNTTG